MTSASSRGDVVLLQAGRPVDMVGAYLQMDERTPPHARGLTPGQRAARQGDGVDDSLAEKPSRRPPPVGRVPLSGPFVQLTQPRKK